MIVEWRHRIVDGAVEDFRRLDGMLDAGSAVAKLAGAQLHIAPRSVAVDGLRLRLLIDAIKPTLVQATPSSWQLLREADWQPAPGLRVLPADPGAAQTQS